MDKSKKKQRYSLRKTQMGVGSVLLATVLLTAGTTRADSVVGQGDGLGLTDGIQGKNGPHIMSLNPDGGRRRNPGDDRKPQVDDEAPRPPRLLDGGTQDGLGDGGKTKVESLAGPDGSGHGGKHLGLNLGGAYIYGNSDRPEVEEPGVHVPEKGNEPKEKLPETPTPLPRVQDQSQPTPKSKPEETPKSAPLKAQPQAQPQSSPSGHSNNGLSEGTNATFTLFSKVEDDKEAKKVKEGIKTEKELKEAEEQEKAAKRPTYPYSDRFQSGNQVVLLFSKFKANIFIKTVGEDGTSTVSYPFYNEQKFKKEIEDLEKGFADTYDVKREDGEKDEDGVKVKTVTLTLTKKGLKPEVTPQPEKPSTPEVAPKPDDKPSVPSKPEVAPQPEKPSVPSKPEVAPKPGDKPSVPSIPEMVPEPEKLEMDKSMKVVPGKPKKATPEAQVPEAQVPQVPQVQVPQSQAPQLPSPKEEVAKVQQQPRAIQSSAPAKSGGKQLPNTGEAASILTLVGSGMLGLLGLAFTKKRKTK
ncbi:LPXTG cell wall anchor domain-containing protein [Streptococcus ruminantium]|uniref:LPXTG cell wall anchor domain-containing protein n=1 Tax=Streptococcus ruminantium TaxID=1917441 RepID=UPI0012DC1E81|nr:LPXTG cell wall anchor domain-containing protein [Streptococcus ruminantium]